MSHIAPQTLGNIGIATLYICELNFRVRHGAPDGEKQQPEPFSFCPTRRDASHAQPAYSCNEKMQ
jgi:hypothetical protein